MTAISTISELLTLSQTQFRIYDIGRKIDKISKEQFNKIELNQIPYPFPLQGHASLAIVFWQKNTNTPYLWFIKLPLDEQGLLNQAARDHFIAIIIEALGANLTTVPNEQQEELLKNNPYHFTPATYKLAALNSKIKIELKQAPSSYFTVFHSYLSYLSNWSEWQNIGVQGITDYAASINQNDHGDILAQALLYLPEEVLFPLCTALENETLPANVIQALIKSLKSTFIQTNENTPEIQQHLIRGLASSTQHPYVINFISELLQQESLSEDILITLSARCWILWQDQNLLLQYFEKLVRTDSILFTPIFKDLVAIPSIRNVVLASIRIPERSSALSKAIGELFTANS